MITSARISGGSDFLFEIGKIGSNPFFAFGFCVLVVRQIRLRRTKSLDKSQLGVSAEHR